jgi:hypothetical protein
MPEDKGLAPAQEAVRQRQGAAQGRQLSGQKGIGRVKSRFVQLMSAVQRAALRAQKRREAQRRAVEGAAGRELGDVAVKKPLVQQTDAFARTEAEE